MIKNEKSRQIMSVFIKLAVAFFASWGLIECFFASGFMGGSSLILYFTMQSNIWIAVADIIIAAFQIKSIKDGTYALNPKIYLIQQVFTVSITLTGCVFCFVLLPAFAAQGADMMRVVTAHEQIFLHVVTPLLAVFDLLVFTRRSSFKKGQFLWAAIPPLYYLFFAMIGYFAKWDFGGGNNYPYFFFNYGSPAGVFGFSDEMPYFMGSFYWIAVLVVFVLSVSALYIAIINRRIKKLPKE